jgi:putative aldouronate transport system permease protein
MVSWYILCTQYLHLKDNIFALIVPYLLNAWNVFLLRNFFSTVPDSIEESAKMDGATDFTILFKIMLPLSLPGIATVALFTTLTYWNDWWLGTMLLNDDKYMPVQVLLMRMLTNVQYMQQHATQMMGYNDFPSEGIRMSTCVIAIGPIIFAYPFVQKYFIKGITVGAVKG